MMFGICFLLLVGLGACLDMYAMDSDGVGRQTPGLAWGALGLLVFQFQEV